MNITVLAVGTKMPRWVDEAVGEYAKRFGRDVNYALKEIKPEKRGAGVNAAQGMAAEEKRLLEAIPQGAFFGGIGRARQSADFGRIGATLEKLAAKRRTRLLYYWRRRRHDRPFETAGKYDDAPFQPDFAARYGARFADRAALSRRFDFAQSSVSSGIICFDCRDKTAMPPCRFERE